MRRYRLEPGSWVGLRPGCHTPPASLSVQHLPLAHPGIVHAGTTRLGASTQTP